MSPSRRRALALVVGTAVLWAGACGSGGSHPSATPTTSPTSGVPASPVGQGGRPTTLPWWSAGLLHLGERVIRTPLHEVVSRGGTTLVGRTTRQGSRWRVLRGHALSGLVSSREQAVVPVVSANGRHLAWVTSRTLRRVDRYTTEALFIIHAYDVASGRNGGTARVESRPMCCDQSGVVRVAAVDDDGTVLVMRDYDRVWRWRPGGPVVPLSGAVRPRAVTGNDQWPRGVSWSTSGDSTGPAAFATIDASGRTVRVGRVPQGLGGLWSPDGTAYVYTPFSKTPGGPPPVVWSPAGRVRLGVRRAVALVGWESSRSVVVLTGRRPTVLVRCDRTSGRCERAGAPLPHVVLPLLPAS